ncbi:NAD(P)/FAD-dependent oxidoreductase [Thermodesulfobacteriota bacterium]
MVRSAVPRVVIVGAGFGGLAAVRALARTPCEVILVDRNNYHTFFPLLYQVAAAEIEPEEIAYPVRNILRRTPNAHFAMREVEGIDLERRVVRTDGPSIAYDYLILATGTTTHYFGTEGAAEHSFPLKSLEQGVALRNHILRCFERAVHEPDRELRQELLTFAIAGGGSTGVEFAGALAELIGGPLLKDYPSLDFRQVRVLLLEATGTLLPGQPEPLPGYALERLRIMGVDVRLESAVGRVTPGGVTLKTGETIPANTTVWMAGVRGDAVADGVGLPDSDRGRIDVLPTLQVRDHPEVYVVGDLARAKKDGRVLPMIAPVAIQQGRTAAGNISRRAAGIDPLAFRYRDMGTMATIGRGAAVVRLYGRSFTGLFAWILWLVVHLANLIGFRNRLLVLINWAWDYFLFERAVRIILPGGPPRSSVRFRRRPD